MRARVYAQDAIDVGGSTQQSGWRWRWRQRRRRSLVTRSPRVLVMGTLMMTNMQRMCATAAVRVRNDDERMLGGASECAHRSSMHIAQQRRCHPVCTIARGECADQDITIKPIRPGAHALYAINARARSSACEFFVIKTFESLHCARRRTHDIKNMLCVGQRIQTISLAYLRTRIASTHTHTITHQPSYAASSQ